jgi:hypothetical protein
MDKLELMQRAHDKALAQLTTMEYSITELKRDIKRGTTGGVSVEQLEACLESDQKELEVWNYIYTLIELDNRL